MALVINKSLNCSCDVHIYICIMHSTFSLISQFCINKGTFCNRPIRFFSWTNFKTILLVNQVGSNSSHYDRWINLAITLIFVYIQLTMRYNTKSTIGSIFKLKRSMKKYIVKFFCVFVFKALNNTKSSITITKDNSTG